MKLLLGILISPLLLFGQDWRPSRIVGMQYPPLADRARIAGHVEIKCTLAPDGRVLKAEPISGRKLLAEPTRANPLECRFERTRADSSMNTVTLIYDYIIDSTSDKNSRFVFESPNHVELHGTFKEVMPTSANPALNTH